MSSSNLVKLAFIPETTYGVTPATGNFKTARFTSEKLSASANTVESQQIRTDRMSSGQVVTGLGLGGDLNFELAKEAALESFLESAMYSTWQNIAAINADLTINTTTKRITRATGSWISDGIKVGDFASLGGFSNAVNNTKVMVAEIVSATVIRYVGPATMVDETDTGNTFTRADKLVIGITKKSFSFQKEFLDLIDKAINYTGMIVNSFSLNVAFGDLITGVFNFLGNGSQAVDDAGDFITDGRTVDPAATTPTFNGSIDMAFLANSAIGILEDSDLAIQSLTLALNNNLSAQNVIGNVAPRDYSAGTAAIEVGLNAYLSDSAWDILPRKLTQEPFALGFILNNPGGSYAFFMPAVQVAFDDPSSPGQNQDISLEMKGTAKVADDGGSALVIYRFV